MSYVEPGVFSVPFTIYICTKHCNILPSGRFRSLYIVVRSSQGIMTVWDVTFSRTLSEPKRTPTRHECQNPGHTEASNAGKPAVVCWSFCTPGRYSRIPCAHSSSADIFKTSSQKCKIHQDIRSWRLLPDSSFACSCVWLLIMISAWFLDNKIPIFSWFHCTQ